MRLISHFGKTSYYLLNTIFRIHAEVTVRQFVRGNGVLFFFHFSRTLVFLFFHVHKRMNTTGKTSFDNCDFSCERASHVCTTSSCAQICGVTSSPSSQSNRMCLWYDSMGWLKGNSETSQRALYPSPMNATTAGSRTPVSPAVTGETDSPRPPARSDRGPQMAPKAAPDGVDGVHSKPERVTLPCPLVWSTDIHSAFYTLDPVAFTVSVDDNSFTDLSGSGLLNSNLQYAFSLTFQLFCGANPSVMDVEKNSHYCIDLNRTALTPPTQRIYRFIDAVYVHHAPVEFPLHPMDTTESSGNEKNSSNVRHTHMRTVSFMLSEPVEFPVRIADLPIDTMVQCCITRHTPPNVPSEGQRCSHSDTPRGSHCGMESGECRSEPCTYQDTRSPHTLYGRQWTAESWRVVFNAFDGDGRLVIGPRCYKMNCCADETSKGERRINGGPLSEDDEHSVKMEDCRWKTQDAVNHIPEHDETSKTRPIDPERERCRTGCAMNSTSRISAENPFLKEELLLRDHYEGRFDPPVIPWLDGMTEKHIQKLRAGAPPLSFSTPHSHSMSSTCGCEDNLDRPLASSRTLYGPATAPFSSSLFPPQERRCYECNGRERSPGGQTMTEKNNCSTVNRMWVGHPIPAQPYPVWNVSESTRLSDALISLPDTTTTHEQQHQRHQTCFVDWAPRSHQTVLLNWPCSSMAADLMSKTKNDTTLLFPVNSMLAYPDFGYYPNRTRRITSAETASSESPRITNCHLPGKEAMNSPTNCSLTVIHGSELNVYEAQAAMLSSSLYSLLNDSLTPPGPRERHRLLELASVPPIPLMVSVTAALASTGSEPSASTSSDGKHIRADDISLLWRYRHFICRDSRYFLPFLRSVRWTAEAREEDKNVRESPQQQAAYKVMSEWSSISLADIFACLSSAFSGVSAVRRFAISHLEKQFEGKRHQQDQLLCRYALPLIHNVRYDSERFHELACFLVQRCSLSSSRLSNPRLCGDSTKILPRNCSDNGCSPNNVLIASGGCWPLCCEVYWGTLVEGGLEEKALSASVGCSDIESQQNVNHTASRAATRGGPLCHLRDMLLEALARDAPSYLLLLNQQQQLVACLKKLCERLVAHGGSIAEKINRGMKKLESGAYGFRELFDTSPSSSSSPSAPTHTYPHNLRLTHKLPHSLTTVRSAVTLPSHPERVVQGVKWNDFYMFKSAKRPIRVSFFEDKDMLHDERTCAHRDLPSPTDRSTADAGLPTNTPPSLVTVMFKVDDEVRYDELVMSMLSIMDQLLQQEGLNLYLTPYRVRPTSPTDGLLEMVPDVVTFESIKGDIKGYWEGHNKTPALLNAAVQRYIKSLAGYSVITFILGVGDRHLENILMAGDGRLLHIDFGYIFGHNPPQRRFSPPMKLRSEMIAVLGGPESSEFHSFLTLCCSAYHILRKHASLLLYILAAFSDARDMDQVTGREKGSGPPTTEGERDMPMSALLSVQKKLRLDLTKKQATKYMLDIISESISARLDTWSDTLHTVAQRTRN